MVEETVGSPNGPGHTAETVRSIAELRAEHQRRSTPLELGVDRLCAILGRPSTLLGLTGVVTFWVAGNLFAPLAGWHSIDPPPFFWLEGAASLSSLYLVILVLASQRREDELEQRRELLSLELAILSEQKTAKVIKLLEEFRRDSPYIPNRIDAEADSMSKPSNPESVLEVINDTQVTVTVAEG